MKTAAILLALILPFAVVAQKQTPEERHKADLAKDVEMGKDYVKELEKELKLSTDEAAIARVQKIGGELAAIANATDVKATWGDGRLNVFEYVFKVVDDKDVNAFSVPGGFIFVNTGLLTDVESDDELAGVLAHEIAHASHRHVVTLLREKSKVDAWTIPIAIAALLGGGAQAGTAIIGSQLLSLALTSGWSERAELDADHAGFAYLIKSSYHPVGLLTFLERLAFREKRNTPTVQWGIYRTHPPSAKRVAQITSLLKENGVAIARSQVTTSYRANFSHEEGRSIVKFGPTYLFAVEGSDSKEQAEAAAQRLNEFFDSSPQLFSVRRDGARLLWGSKELAKLTTPDAAEEALKNIKNCIYSLGYRTGG